MTIVADASSLILLSKAGLAEELAQKISVIIPQKVYEEIIKGLEKGRYDSILIQRMVAEKIVIVEKADPKIMKRMQSLFSLHGGELEVISLAKKDSTILTDDKKCMNAAKALKINCITSPDAIVALWKTGAISKIKAQEGITSLEEYGWYSKKIMKHYEEAMK